MMTDKDFIGRIFKELHELYQFLDEDKQLAFDVGEVAVMIKMYQEQKNDKEDEDDEER